jgi:glycosyltransferase involved in cell wall biosynthesis
VRAARRAPRARARAPPRRALDVNATVVIPTYNRAQRLAELLRCLAAQTAGTLARVVVCDDGSPDDTAAVAQRFARALPLVYCRQDDLGFRAGQARNLGIERAVGDVVIFLDDDLLVAPDFVASHLAAHVDAPGARAAIGYRHRTFHPQHDVPTYAAITASEPDDRAEVLGPDGAAVTDHVTPWFFVYSCNFSVRRTAALPRFDEAFVGWGMEDLEYGYRLHRDGYAVVAAPRARALHVEDPRPRDPFRCETRQLPPAYDSYVRNSVYFMDKYPHDEVLARMIRQDMRWYVRDEARGAWVKNGHANDVEAVIAHCRRERERDPQRAAARRDAHEPAVVRGANSPEDQAP